MSGISGFFHPNKNPTNKYSWNNLLILTIDLNFRPETSKYHVRCNKIRCISEGRDPMHVLLERFLSMIFGGQQNIPVLPQKKPDGFAHKKSKRGYIYC